MSTDVVATATSPAKGLAATVAAHKVGIAIGTAAFVGGGFLTWVATADQRVDDGVEEVAVTTATVQLRDLVDEESLDGTVVRGDPLSVRAHAPGTLLDFPDNDDRFSLGEVVYFINNEASEEQLKAGRSDLITAGEALVRAIDIRDTLIEAPDATDLEPLRRSLVNAEDALEDLVEGPTAAAIADAQARVNERQEDFDDVADGASAVDLALAQARVQVAQDALNDVLEPATEGEILEAEAALEAAEDRLDFLEDISSGDLNDATRDLETALDDAEGALETAQDTQRARQADFLTAQEDYCDEAKAIADVCAASNLTDTQSAALVTQISTELGLEDPDGVVAVADALIDADAAYDAAIAAVAAASRRVSDADDALDQAEDDLEDPDDAAIDAAQAAVLLAEERLDELTDDPAFADVATAQANLLNAQDILDDLLDGPDAVDLARAQADLQLAQQALEDLIEGPTPADIEVAELAVASAQIELQDELDGPSSTDRELADFNVERAQLGVDLAEAGLDDLLAGPQPAILMYGPSPAYRDMRRGIFPGEDVAQLQANLSAIGFGDLEVDGVFGGGTEAAVRAWQESLNVRVTGEVKLGQVVFVEGPATVTGVSPGLLRGDPVATGVQMFQLVATEEVSADGSSESTQRVLATLPVDDRELVEVDKPAVIELPDETRINGVIVDVGLIAIQSASGTESQLQIEIIPDEPIDDLWSDAAVTVDVEEVLAENVLVAPVPALIALAEGGYAVELVDGDTTRLVAVEVGDFADNLVEISGAEISEGVELIVPA